jgi:glycerol-3-phosphate responsive antiterminator
MKTEIETLNLILETLKCMDERLTDIEKDIYEIKNSNKKLDTHIDCVEQAYQNIKDRCSYFLKNMPSFNELTYNI